MKPIRLNRLAIPILSVLALLGSVWIAKAAGTWQTSGRGDLLLDANSNADPAGIKGWMTLGFVSQTYGVPLDALYAMIGASSDLPTETELRELEKLVPGAEVSAIRLGVAAYLEGTWAPTDKGNSGGSPAPEPTPAPAVDHTPEGPGAGAGEGSGPAIVFPADGSPLPGSEIRGRMTLAEVVDLCQVPLDVLIAELGLPQDVDPSLRMSDLVQQMGIEVLTIREVVTRYQAGH